MRLAIVATHPVQYYAPLYRELARRCNLKVFYAHDPDPQQQGAAGFGTAFTWDVDLLEGYRHVFLNNVSATPDASRFSGCDTPEIGARLAEGDFDAVLVMGWYTKTHLQALLACKRQRRRVLVRSDSQLGQQPSRVKRAIKAVSYPLFLGLFDAALYVGVRSKAFFRAYGYPEARLFHAPHAIDTARFAKGREGAAALRRAEGIPQHARVVAFAGKLVAFKRPGDVIDAVAALRSAGQDLRVMIIGTGPLREALHDMAQARDVPLHDLGFVNQSAVPAALAAANVLVLPSTGRETWGLVANEALAAGTPVIVSDACGCAPDLASDGVAGRRYPVGDIAALQEAISACLAAPPDPKAIAELSERFTLSRAAEGILRAAAGP